MARLVARGVRSLRFPHESLSGPAGDGRMGPLGSPDDSRPIRSEYSMVFEAAAIRSKLQGHRFVQRPAVIRADVPRVCWTVTLDPRRRTGRRSGGGIDAVRTVAGSDTMI